MERKFSEIPIADATFLVFDTETSLGSKKGEPAFYDLVEIGIIVFGSQRGVIDKYHSFVRPHFPFNRASCKAMHITESVLANAPVFPEIASSVDRVFGEHMVVGQNTQFDIRAVRHATEEYQRTGGLEELLAKQLTTKLERQHLDTKDIFSQAFPSEPRRSLDVISRRLGIDPTRTLHSALDDANLTLEVFKRLLILVQNTGAMTLQDLLDFQSGSFGKPKQEPLF